MKAALITVDSLRADAVPEQFIRKWNPTVYTRMYSFFHSTVPSLTSFYTGVPPQWHGILDHHHFYDYKLKAHTIFQVLREKGVEVAFYSDEKVVREMQCVADVPKLNSIEELTAFLKHENRFAAAHLFFTHSPYGDETVQRLIGEKQKLTYLDSEFLALARKAYEKRVNEAFKIIDQLLQETSVNAVVSGDHGEAFGEELLRGHDNILLHCVLHIPFLVIDHSSPRLVERVTYSSEAFKLICSWFKIKPERTFTHKSSTIKR